MLQSNLEAAKMIEQLVRTVWKKAIQGCFGWKNSAGCVDDAIATLERSWMTKLTWSPLVCRSLLIPYAL
jgi:hypothetical protein